MADGNKVLTREHIAERDYRIFAMKKAGVSAREIAKRFDLTTSAVNKAVERVLARMNSEARLNYSDVLRLELERLDGLQASLWPLTQNRKKVLDDGNEVMIEPDIKAVQQVLAIIDRRAKLLGMDRVNVNVQMAVDAGPNLRATLAGQEGARELTAHTPEADARRLMELMASTGVLPHHVVKELMSRTDGVIDAEVIEDGGGQEAS